MEEYMVQTITLEICCHTMLYLSRQAPQLCNIDRLGTGPGIETKYTYGTANAECIHIMSI